jgi:hypothetical protein
VDLDRQSIERRDFPIGRRGYDPSAVDVHLRNLAAAVEQLQRERAGDASLAMAAGNQVQSIIQAAETAAAEIERTALENARQMRERAERDAERTREEALEKARAHVSAVSHATAGLLERVGSMDGEVNGLIESLRAGASRLAADLTSVESGMGELYGAASNAGAAQPGVTAAAAPPAQQPLPGTFEAELESAISSPAVASGAEIPREPAAPAPPVGTGNDIDGARLIALNMALNGESRSDTERYLAENFQLDNRIQLIDEVYAAIEG